MPDLGEGLWIDLSILPILPASLPGMKESLFGKTQDELKQVASTLGFPAFTARQMADWLYKKNIASIDEMSNLSKKARAALSDRYDLGISTPEEYQESADGTRKYLFKIPGNHFVETAYIPDKDRHTVCVSSQVGCKMGCHFCMTGKQGFQRNLSARDILTQFRGLPEWSKLSNMVYMGMGEPFDNLDEVLKSLEVMTSDWGFALSPRRITVSSVGIVPAVRTFLESTNAHLAISLHNPFEEERQKMMPVQKAQPIKKVLEEIRSWDFGRQRRVSFEYILFKGLNDSTRHINELARLLQGIRCRINLIRFHSIPDTPFIAPGEAAIHSFRDGLNAKGIISTIRASRGQDIQAACGLLSTKRLLEG